MSERDVSRHCEVRNWPEADVAQAPGRARFQRESGRNADWLSLPSLTLSGHRRGDGGKLSRSGNALGCRLRPHQARLAG